MHKIFHIFALTLLVLSVISASFAFADIVVITHPEFGVKVDLEQVKDAFLGKSSEIGGQIVVAIDQPLESRVRQSFAEKVLGKSPRQLSSYWSYKIFTGRAIPPEIRPNDALVKKMVASTPGAIGYIDRKNVDTSVKVVLTIKE